MPVDKWYKDNDHQHEEIQHAKYTTTNGITTDRISLHL